MERLLLTPYEKARAIEAIRELGEFGFDVADPWQGGRLARLRLIDRYRVREPVGCPEDVIADWRAEQEELAGVLAGQALAVQGGDGGSSLWFGIRLFDVLADHALLGANGEMSREARLAITSAVFRELEEQEDLT